MRIRTSSVDLADLAADLAVCFAREGETAPSGVTSAPLRRALAARMKAERFRGRPGDAVLWNADGAYAADRFLVVGVGTSAEPAALRAACARAARTAVGLHARTLAVRLPAGRDGGGDADDVRAAVEGIRVGAYRFDRYLTDPDRRGERIARVEVSSSRSAAAARRAARAGDAAGSAVDVARDLVNEPPSTLDPAEFTRRARALARKAGLTVRVLSKKDLERLGTGALLAVARGSAVEPRVVHLTYRPKDRSRGPRRRIVLVGKGVTFDSGGLNLKPTASMLDMKCDMAGAAAVVATMSALAAAGCRDEVHGLVGLVENMTGAAAYKPGDILRTYLGKTVEVTNTDAEGRLVLADVLAYAARTLSPDAMVDVATLTGACVVALGTGASGLFTRDDALREALLGAAAAAGEKVWAMPMYDEYLESLQGGPADLKNTGDRWGGAITAALFLGEFVPREVAWAHVDIAGPAFRERPGAGTEAGATGAAVRTLLRWLEPAGRPAR